MNSILMNEDNFDTHDGRFGETCNDEDADILGSELQKYEQELLKLNKLSSVTSPGNLEKDLNANMRRGKLMMKLTKDWLVIFFRNFLGTDHGSLIKDSVSFSSLLMDYHTYGRIAIERINFINGFDPTLSCYTRHNSVFVTLSKLDKPAPEAYYNRDRISQIYSAVFREDSLSVSWPLGHIASYTWMLTKDCLKSWMDAESAIKDSIFYFFKNDELAWWLLYQLRRFVENVGYVNVDLSLKAVLLTLYDYFYRTNSLVLSQSDILLREFSFDKVNVPPYQMKKIEPQTELIDLKIIWNSTLEKLKVAMISTYENFSEVCFRLILASRESTMNVFKVHNQKKFLDEIRNEVMKINSELDTSRIKFYTYEEEKGSKIKSSMDIGESKCEVQLRFTKEFLLFKETVALRKHLRKYDEMLARLEEETSSLFTSLPTASHLKETRDFLKRWQGFDKCHSRIRFNLDRHKNYLDYLEKFYEKDSGNEIVVVKTTDGDANPYEESGVSSVLQEIPPFYDSSTNEVVFEGSQQPNLENDDEIEIEDEIFEALGACGRNRSIDNINRNSTDKTGFRLLVEELKDQLVDRKKSWQLREMKAKKKKDDVAYEDKSLRHTKKTDSEDGLSDFSDSDSVHSVEERADKTETNEIPSTSDDKTLCMNSQFSPSYQEELRSALTNRNNMCLTEDFIGDASDEGSNLED